MHTRIMVWGSRELIESITENYYKPKVFNVENFKKAYDKILPRPIIHGNPFVGTTCSVTPIVGNILLVDQKFLVSPQQIMEIPSGFENDISLPMRASESYSLEVFPDLSVDFYHDFIVEIVVKNTSWNDNLVDHFKQTLNQISPEHCFGWLILSRHYKNLFHRQILRIQTPEKMRMPKGYFEPAKIDSDFTIFSYNEYVISKPGRNSFSLLKPLLIKGDEKAISLGFDTEYFQRIYWPSEVTPHLFRSTIDDYFSELYGHSIEIIFERKPVYSSFTPTQYDECSI